jgi:hypothetical protein
MYVQTRYLLDKVTARLILEAQLRLIEKRSIDEVRVSALYFFNLARVSNFSLYIVPQTAQLLHKLEPIPRYGAAIRYFSQHTEVTTPGRYYARWARRLRRYGFTREDAAVLALATFGIDTAGAISGIHYLATFDQPMINNWNRHQADIRTRFEAMRQSLSEPYNSATLPQLLHLNIDAV